MMAARPVNDSEEDVDEICEDGRCIADGIETIKLWYCVRCDSTYCKYEMDHCHE